jgi:hypothetical protein
LAVFCWHKRPAVVAVVRCFASCVQPRIPEGEHESGSEPKNP